jgi:sulfur-oxidizing protein SoxX
MRRPISVLVGAGAALLLASLFATPAVQAMDKAPTEASCKDNPSSDPVMQGACAAITRTKGNCHSCHMLKNPGFINYGNVAPPLVGMKARFPDEKKLRDQVSDATKANPNTVMPPFGRHGILSEDEIDKIVKFLLTL